MLPPNYYLLSRRRFLPGKMEFSADFGRSGLTGVDGEDEKAD